MTKNIGSLDRMFRIGLGTALIAFALLSSHNLAVWGWIGVVPLATGLVRWCPAYLPFGLRTCKTS